MALIDEIWGRGACVPPAELSPSVVLDVGSNIGLSLLWWNSQYPNCRIVAVEPDPRSQQILRSNVASWGIEQSVIVLDCAVAPVRGPVAFCSHGESMGETTNSTVVQGNPLDGGIRTLLCDGVPLSDLMSQHKPSLVKIDIEGAEYAVLEEWITGGLPGIQDLTWLVIEFHHMPESYNSLLLIVEALREEDFVPRDSEGKVIAYGLIDSYPTVMWFARKNESTGYQES